MFLLRIRRVTEFGSSTVHLQVLRYTHVVGMAWLMIDSWTLYK